MEFNVGDIWMWTKNSAEHPDDPDYNYFLITEIEWGYRVLYIKDGRVVQYAALNFDLHGNKGHLVKVA